MCSGTRKLAFRKAQSMITELKHMMRVMLSLFVVLFLLAFPRPLSERVSKGGANLIGGSTSIHTEKPRRMLYRAQEDSKAGRPGKDEAGV